MVGRLRFVGVGAVCLAMITVVPVTAQRIAVGQGLTASILSVYTPPACVPGVPFADVTCTTGFDPWIEQFALDGITAGCGGGDYCPGSPVTRDQMAVFIEKAMRGTANWPPHTVLVFHHPAAEAGSDVNSGTELLSLVAAIPSTGAEAPSASNPWLIKVGPGSFDLGSGSLTLPAYTALEGAGQDITVITAAGYADQVHGTVIMGASGRLSRLTVNNSGGNTYENAVYLPSPAIMVVLENATLTASNPTNATGIAMCLLAEDGTSFSLVGCDLTAHGAASNTGIWAGISYDESRLDGVRIRVYGSDATNGQSYGFYGLSSSPVITNSHFEVSGGMHPYGIYATIGVAVTLRDSEVRTFGPDGSGAGVILFVGGALQGNTILSQGVGIAAQAHVDIINCRIEGGTSWLASWQGATVTVGASKLVGTTNNSGGTVNCFANYTGSAFLANTCP